jgi:uncharacterized protein (TIGR00369 family)
MNRMQAARDVIAERLLGSPVAQHLGLLLRTVESGSVRLALPFSPANVTVGSIVHGGVIATLADVAAVAAAVLAAPVLPTGGATSSLSISYVAPADGDALVARARVVRAGSRQHVVRVEIQNDRGEPVAEALVTVMLA